jgi:hypothetical protein
MSGAYRGWLGPIRLPRVDESGGRHDRRGWIDTSAWERSESGRRRVARRIVREGGGRRRLSVLILGLLLLLLGYLTGVGILQTLGIILLVVGAILWILGSMGRPVGGRRHYW